ncbi:thermonuclease family protein [Sphingobacterium chuzhouense]|uniref:Thermonuclease family protein n=1 Tax=Sphingobacterium chuzhouense TaxID=1742264 RepID=A0ABR7XR28_9SPHI|nr:thermonuclease family protein [Sphingobacterium chuzhouense]MBD1421621.1 thermonuclease family protein [Sphingobacterium chuzhouense]
MKRLLAYFLFILPHLCLSQNLSGKVIRVTDGDIITILDSTNTQVRIRLYGIDCPENGQDFANAAKKFTSDLCFSKVISVDVKDIDRYGRTVGIVWAQDSINVNFELLRGGLAWHYKYFDQLEEVII